MSDFSNRVDERVRAWRVAEERRIETASSVLVFGRRERQAVVVKVIKDSADEWSSGSIIAAFGGRAVVRVYDFVDGAVLLEWLTPGVTLATHARGRSDDDATAVLAGVIRRMAPRVPDGAVPAAHDWAGGFERYLRSGDRQIPAPLVVDARCTYEQLCASQTHVRLLHGDLHHFNVLFDADRGWVAIDPKGVLGELEYEVGAALRNPFDRPNLFSDASIVRRRIETFRRELSLDPVRVTSWAFAQAVLSAIWSVEDGCSVPREDARLALAGTLQRLAQGSDRGQLG